MSPMLAVLSGLEQFLSEPRGRRLLLVEVKIRLGG